MTDARSTRLPPVPNVPRGLGKDVERFLSALKERSEVFSGSRGDVIDRAVTQRELDDAVSSSVATAIANLSSSTVTAATGGEGSASAVTITTDELLDKLSNALSSTQFTDEFNEQLGTALADAGRIGQDLSDVQDVLSGNVTALSGLASAADTLPYFTGSETMALTGFTAAGRAIVDDADATAQRATLGLGNSATRNVGTAGTDVAAGNRGLPTGGTAGQVLYKIDGTDYNVGWTTHTTLADGVNFTFGTTTGTKIGTATTEKLAFWNSTPVAQPASASQAAVSGTAGAAYTATEQTLINDLVTLVNQLRADLVTLGIIKGAA